MKTTRVMAAVMALLATGLATGAVAQDRMQRQMPDFATLDADGNGSLTMEELQARHAARFADADTDGDGGLSAEELTAMASAQRAERAAARATRMIERMDANDDGILQQSEMQRGDNEGPSRMFGRIDTDDDGVISAAEFDAAKARFEERAGRHGDRDGKRDRG